MYQHAGCKTGGAAGSQCPGLGPIAAANTGCNTKYPFEGPNSVGAGTHASAHHPQRSSVLSTVVNDSDHTKHVAHQLTSDPCSSLSVCLSVCLSVSHSPFIISIGPDPTNTRSPTRIRSNTCYAAVFQVRELRCSRFRTFLNAHFNITVSTFRGWFQQIGITTRLTSWLPH